MAQEGATQNQKKASEEGGIVLFEDECIFQQSGTIIRSWGQVGRGSEIFSKPGRNSCKVYGAVSVDPKKPKLHFRFLKARGKNPRKRKFNTDTFIGFLKTILRYYQPKGQMVHMILDNVKYHESALAWVEKHSDFIELHFLPPYSPNLNAAEKIWQKTERDALN